MARCRTAVDRAPDLTPPAGPGPDAPRTRADRAGWTARPTSRDAPGTPDGLRGGRRQACTGSALVVASLERTTTTGHGAACRQSRATGPSGVPAWGAGPAGPRPGRVLPSTSISAPTERSSRTGQAARRPAPSEPRPAACRGPRAPPPSGWIRPRPGRGRPRHPHWTAAAVRNAASAGACPGRRPRVPAGRAVALLWPPTAERRPKLASRRYPPGFVRWAKSGLACSHLSRDIR